MKSQEFRQLLDRYMRGECTPEESAFIEEWYRNMEEAGSTIRPESVASTEEALWRKISPERVVKRDNLRLIPVVRIAAVLAIMLSAGWFVMENLGRNQQLQVPTAQSVHEPSSTRIVANTTSQPISVSLKDGSRIVLQPNSEVSFDEELLGRPAGEEGTKREVFLTGEAFFDVRRDEKRPFLVYSKELVTKVLGTSFNIKAYDGDKEITVAVKTGKVSVYHTPEGQEQTAEENEAVILRPNQQAVYDKTNESVIKQLVEKPEIVVQDSKLFRMSFEEHPVSGIFGVLEEHYGVDIVYDEETLKRCTLTTAMSDEGLYQRIEVICKAIKAKYTVAEGMIFIESPGCN
jgi:ferric-dicitrate binding protein FerR (iron transport regulator)